MSDTQSPQYLERIGKPPLAYLYTAPTNTDMPTIVFCGGFKSDMRGTKAWYLEQQCIKSGYGFLRFDYSGHGESGGDFAHGTIGQWALDAKDVMTNLALEKMILIGSSMGGWISLIIGQDMPDKIKAMIGIAAAPDFTDDLFYKRLDEQQRQTIMAEGKIEIPNDYSDEPYIFTKALIEEGRENFVLGGNKETDIKFAFPIHLLQGKLDTDVPWQRAEEIKQAVSQPEVKITYIEEGDHRLSSDSDLVLLWQTVENFAV